MQLNSLSVRTHCCSELQLSHYKNFVLDCIRTGAMVLRRQDIIDFVADVVSLNFYRPISLHGFVGRHMLSEKSCALS